MRACFLGLLTLVAVPAFSFGWGDIGSSRFNPTGVYQLTGPGAAGPGAYKYGYGDYSDRYGYRPDAPANANLNPIFPAVNLGGYKTYTPPNIYPTTTFGGYGTGTNSGYRTPTMADSLIPGVFR